MIFMKHWTIKRETIEEELYPMKKNYIYDTQKKSEF